MSNTEVNPILAHLIEQYELYPLIRPDGRMGIGSKELDGGNWISDDADDTLVEEVNRQYSEEDKTQWRATLREAIEDGVEDEIGDEHWRGEDGDSDPLPEPPRVHRPPELPTSNTRSIPSDWLHGQFKDTRRDIQNVRIDIEEWGARILEEVGKIKQPRSSHNFLKFLWFMLVFWVGYVATDRWVWPAIDEAVCSNSTYLRLTDLTCVQKP